MADKQKRLTIKVIRQKLHELIMIMEDKKVRALYCLLEDEIEGQFTKEEIDLFEKRRSKRLQGKSKTYRWTEARKIIAGHQRNVKTKSLILDK